ncbi:helix-turn-helix domain-containing protein [Caballeronia sp. LZ032]|uniref:helix-turn-helix domain-containing protein n=1 Tax=Caballeronia sp. LZ032 TaxID=3038565 RepID=UPI00285B5A7C|nr:helix-turn-helix domain-containing protein [Caballeronia sp. LZ032]MDR5881250.1 helix-turn-helix domain-containing protein [Caballeronia sp. LZ032]
MAVSNVSSSSSSSTQQYDGNDDTTSTNNNSTSDPPPSSTGNDTDNAQSPQTDGNDAENPSSTQKDPSQGQSTLSQIPPADTAGTNTTSNTPSPSPGNETGNAASTLTDTSGGQSGSSQTRSANTATTDKNTNTATSNPPPQSSAPSSGNGTGNATSTQTPSASTAANSTTSSQPTASPAPSTGNGSNGASSTQTTASAGELTITEKEPTNKVTTTITPANQSTSSPAQPANPSTNTATNAPTSAPSKLTNVEATQLLLPLDKDTSGPNDAQNARLLAAYQRDALRGADPAAIGFEQQTTLANQQLGSLSSDQRAHYGDALAQGASRYNAAATSAERASIAESVRTTVFEPLHDAYQQAMADPMARVQQTFSDPFGLSYLGTPGQLQNDQLAQMRRQFNQAATSQERARIFGQAADLRHTMQSQIASFINQQHSQLESQWQQADQEIDKALAYVAGMQFGSAGSGYRDTSAFERLHLFMANGLTSERNVQEFQYRLGQTPDDFKQLHDWSAEAIEKATWATSALHGDLFRRAPVLPPLPPDPTQTTTEHSRMGNFGADMLYRYQQEDRRILDAEEMVRAASSPALEKGQYLDAHTQPLPTAPLLPILAPDTSLMQSAVNITSDIANERSKSSSDGTTQGAASASSPPVSTVETIGGPKPPAPDPALAAAAAANAVKPVTLSNTEATQLLSRLDKNPSIPDDAANANSLAGLQRDSLRSADSGAIGFEQQAIQANQEVEALPSQQHDFHRGALAAGTTYYNAAITEEQREKIAHAVRTDVIDPISRAYLQAMVDPNARVQMAFNKPFGSVYLGAAGMQQVDLLARMGQQFNQAATAEERARIFEQAADLRHVMQAQIATFVDQERSHVQEQWKQADKEINQALAEAKGMWVASAESGLDNTSSFERLNWFMNHGLNSERNAQEFQYRLSKSPDDFKPLREWSADATKKAEWAISALQSDPFHRTPVLPPLPPDPTQTNIDNLRMGNFGGDLLYRYQLENRSILDAMNMYHAASQHGPIETSYLDAHTPPLPLWRQQLDDGLGRFFVGLIPGVNLLVDYIVPAQSLPEWARQGIDFASALVGSMLGEAKLPKFGGSSESKAGSGFKPSETVKPAEGVKPGEEPKLKEEVKPGEGNAKDESANAPKPEITTPVPGSTAATSGSTSGIPLVPQEYARPPSGKLTPDPNYRGLYRDEGGQNYIQQDGKTYPVKWNENTHSWQMEPREGSPNSPNMRLNEKGNWEVNLDTGLQGGVPRSGILAFYKQAFDLYERGQNLTEIADALHVSRATVKRYIERYALKSGDLGPVRIGGMEDPFYRNHSSLMYRDFYRGRSLTEVANKFTHGDALAAYRNAMWYAETCHFPTDVIPRERPWRIAQDMPVQSQPERAPNQIRIPMTDEQSAKVNEGIKQGKSTEEISKDTGLPPGWVEQIKARNGQYFPQAHEWIQTGNAPDPAGAPAQQLHSAVEPGGTQQPHPETSGTAPEPQPGTSGTAHKPQPGTSRTAQHPSTASTVQEAQGANAGRMHQYRHAFELYERGYAFPEIERRLGLGEGTAEAWVEHYMSDSGEVIPQRIPGEIENIYMARGAAIYAELTQGRPLQEVADKFTDGEEIAALRAGLRYARKEHLPTYKITQDRPWRIQPGGTTDQLTYPVTGMQRADILRSLDRGEPNWLISEQTGVPEDVIEHMRAGAGRYESGNVRDAGEPPAKRQRTDAGPGDTGQTQTGTAGATQPEHVAPPEPETSWGSKQLQQFSEDHTKLSKAEADSIDAWLDGNSPAPQSLQAELTARGYSDITPEMILTFLTGNGPELTARQMQRIAEFAGF